MTPLIILVLASAVTGSQYSYSYRTPHATVRMSRGFPSVRNNANKNLLYSYKITPTVRGNPRNRNNLPSADLVQETQNMVNSVKFSNPQKTYIRKLPTRKIASNKDVFQQTKSLVDSLTPSLRALANDPKSAAIANKFIQENYLSCVSSLDEGIASIQTATELLESARCKITAFTDKIDSFTKLRDPVEIVRETGAMLRLMKPLLEDSQSVDLDKCQAQAGAATPFNNNGIPAFIGQLRSVSSRLENICSQGEFNRDSITAIGDIMDIVADLYRSVGDVQTGEKIRGGKTFTHRLMVS